MKITCLTVHKHKELKEKSKKKNPKTCSDFGYNSSVMTC